MRFALPGGLQDSVEGTSIFCIDCALMPPLYRSRRQEKNRIIYLKDKVHEG